MRPSALAAKRSATVLLTVPLMRVVVFAGGSGSEHENCGRARLRNQFLYDSRGFFCMILNTSMHTRPVTCSHS